MIKGEADLRFPRGVPKERMRLSRPQRYAGRGDAQVLDVFVAGKCEEQRVRLASCVLEGQARQWWLYLCNGHERPRRIDDVDSFVQALLGRFTDTPTVLLFKLLVRDEMPVLRLVAIPGLAPNLNQLSCWERTR